MAWPTETQRFPKVWRRERQSSKRSRFRWDVLTKRTHFTGGSALSVNLRVICQSVPQFQSSSRF